MVVSAEEVVEEGCVYHPGRVAELYVVGGDGGQFLGVNDGGQVGVEHGDDGVGQS